MIWLLLGVYIVVWTLMVTNFCKGLENSKKYNQTEDIAYAQNATKNIKHFIVWWIISMVITLGNIIYFILK